MPEPKTLRPAPAGMADGTQQLAFLALHDFTIPAARTAEAAARLSALEPVTLDDDGGPAFAGWRTRGDLTLILARFGLYARENDLGVHVHGITGDWVYAGDLNVVVALQDMLPVTFEAVLAEARFQDRPLYAMSVRRGELVITRDVETTYS